MTREKSLDFGFGFFFGLFGNGWGRENEVVAAEGRAEVTFEAASSIEIGDALRLSSLDASSGAGGGVGGRCALFKAGILIFSVNGLDGPAPFSSIRFVVGLTGAGRTEEVPGCECAKHV